MRLPTVFLAGLATLLFTGAAEADTWNVTGTGDQSTGCVTLTHLCPSIRSAVAASVGTTGDDTINAPAGLVTITKQIDVTTNVTIVGASARTTIIDGSATTRGFGVTAGVTATFSHLTVRNGEAGSGDGGAIAIAGGSVSLDYVR